MDPPQDAEAAPNPGKRQPPSAPVIGIVRLIGYLGYRVPQEEQLRDAFVDC